MNIEILGSAKDMRTNTDVLYAKMTIDDYLNLVGDDFDKFEIQRRRESHKGYGRLREDIKKGALLPTITLAVKPDHVKNLLPYLHEQNWKGLADALAHQGQVSILDGLQRTYILSDLAKSGIQFVKGQTLLVEFWLEQNSINLTYRIIVLNAGQKPMSMRHQIEILFSTIATQLEKEIPGLQILAEKDREKRKQSRQYALDRIVLAYQSYMTKTPEVTKQNLVSDRLNQQSIMDNTEEDLGEQFKLFKNYLNMYAEIDDEVCRIYINPKTKGTSYLEDDIYEPVPDGMALFGSDTMMNAFFAALGDYGSTDEKKGRIQKSLNSLIELLRLYPEGADPLGLQNYQIVRQGIPQSKVNLGVATRRLVKDVFREYFTSQGESSIAELWQREAS